MDLAREPKETACARCSTPFDSTQKDHLVSKACEVYFSSLDDLIAVEEGDRICSLCYTAFRRHTMRQSKEQDEKKKICACCKKKSAGGVCLLVNNYNIRHVRLCFPAADASPGSRMCRNCYDVVRMRAVRAAHSASGLQQVYSSFLVCLLAHCIIFRLPNPGKAVSIDFPFRSAIMMVTLLW